MDGICRLALSILVSLIVIFLFNSPELHAASVDSGPLISSALLSSFGGSLSDPNSIVLDLDGSGTWYVSNGKTNSISKVSRDGVITFFASVDRPRGLAFDKERNLYVGCIEEKVYKVTPDGFVTLFAEGFNRPAGLAFDQHGYLYVADSWDANIKRVSPNGSVSIFHGSDHLYFPSNMVFDKAGNLYVTNSDRITKISPYGSSGIFAKFNNGVNGLVIDDEGNLFVSGSLSNISKITPDGVITEVTSDYRLGTIYDLAFAKDEAGNGALYAVNNEKHSILKVSPTGEVSDFARSLCFPRGVATDKQGNVYVANFDGGTVSKITPDGAETTFSSGFYSPQALAMDETGTLYVATNCVHSSSHLCHDSVWKVSADGSVSAFAILDLYCGPIALSFYQNGTLFVACNWGSSVTVSPDGVISKSVLGSYHSYWSFAIDPYDSIYGADSFGLYKTQADGVTTLLFKILYPSIVEAMVLDNNNNLYITQGTSIYKIDPSGITTELATSRFRISGLAADSSRNLLYAANYGDSLSKISITKSRYVSQ